MKVTFLIRDIQFTYGDKLQILRIIQDDGQYGRQNYESVTICAMLWDKLCQLPIAHSKCNSFQIGSHRQFELLLTCSNC